MPVHIDGSSFPVVTPHDCSLDLGAAHLSCDHLETLEEYLKELKKGSSLLYSWIRYDAPWRTKRPRVGSGTVLARGATNWGAVSIPFDSWNPRPSLLIAWSLIYFEAKVPWSLCLGVSEKSLINYVSVVVRRVKCMYSPVCPWKITLCFSPAAPAHPWLTAHLPRWWAACWHLQAAYPRSRKPGVGATPATDNF